jgi:hypothetical protein
MAKIHLKRRRDSSVSSRTQDTGPHFSDDVKIVRFRIGLDHECRFKRFVPETEFCTA